MSIYLNLLLSAIHRKCEKDIRLFHENNTELGFPLPKNLRLAACDVLTAEPAWEPVPTDEEYILEDEEDVTMFGMDSPVEGTL